MPDAPTREAPIIRTTVPKIKQLLKTLNTCWNSLHQPVTIGGNTRCNNRGGANDMNISRKEQINEVPIYKYTTFIL